MKKRIGSKLYDTETYDRHGSSDPCEDSTSSEKGRFADFGIYEKDCGADMNKKLKPVRCGCGGEAIIYINGARQAKIYCEKCGIESNVFATKHEAITAWNRAMSGSTEKSSTVERTAKVEEAVPNMTILKRKVDLQSILQAIKTDKIRVWLNYDGKICFQNTKTGNEISVEPYYDMEGNTINE